MSAGRTLNLRANVAIKTNISAPELTVICCERMKTAIARGTVIHEGNFAIRGRPRFVGDEEIGYDDVTEKIDIEFCPFCGERLDD